MLKERMYPKYRGEMGFEGKSRKAFLHFMPNLAIFDEFSKWSMPKVLLLNFEKSSNMAKNWQKMKKRLV